MLQIEVPSAALESVADVGLHTVEFQDWGPHVQFQTAVLVLAVPVGQLVAELDV